MAMPLATTMADDGGEPVHFAGTGESPEITERYAAGTPTGPADTVALGNPFGVEIVGDHVFLTTVDDHCVWKASIDGSRVERIAGCGLIGYQGDGGPALQATFNWPHEVRVDESGGLWIADTRNHVIRHVDAGSGTVTTIAGDGQPGFAGEGMVGREVQFKHPHSVVLDGAGGVLVADTHNHRLRRIDLESGVVETIAGTGQAKMPSDGADAAVSSLFGPRSLAVDDDSIWIALREGNSVWRIDRQTNRIHHIAGTGKKGYDGDGGSARQATFNGPKGLVMDDQGRLLIVDTENHAIRRIDLAADTVTTVLGGRLSNSSTKLKRPHGISFHPGHGFVVADSEKHRVLIGR